MRAPGTEPPTVKRIENRAVNPACELEPEVHEKQREFDTAQEAARVATLSRC